MDIPISTQVIEKVAAQEGVDPTDMTDPLHEAIDPDALDELLYPQPGTIQSDLQVAFSYAGCDIVVYGDGRVKVAESNPRPT